MASSASLYNILLYALFAAAGEFIVILLAWRLMAWCLFRTARLWTWTRSLPVCLRIPVLVGLLLLAWPLLPLALVAWILVRIFPGLAAGEGDVPRLFAPIRSRIVSQLIHFFFFLPFILAPLNYLADQLGAPQVSVWHWVLVIGPVSVLVFWFVARLRRKSDEI